MMAWSCSSSILTRACSYSYSRLLRYLRVRKYPPTTLTAPEKNVCTGVITVETILPGVRRMGTSKKLLISIMAMISVSSVAPPISIRFRQKLFCGFPPFFRFLAVFSFPFSAKDYSSVSS